MMHYAWIILICCCLIEMGSLGLINCVGLYVAPVCGDFGIGAASFSLYLSVQMLSIAATAAICGKIIQNIGIKRSLLIGAAAIALLFWGLSTAKSIGYFYFFGVLFGPALNLVMMLPVPMLISNWFYAQKGLAMGIAMTFAGIGGAIFSLSLSKIIAAFGWRSGYMTMAILALVLTLPWIMLLLKDTPEQKNTLPYGYQKNAKSVSSTAVSVRGVDEKAVLKMPVFWLTLLFAGLITYVCNYATYLSAYGTANGLSIVAGGMLVSAAMVGNMAGALLLGGIADRLGIAKAIYISVALIICATLVLILGGQNMAALLLAATVFGLSSTMYSTMIPLFVEHVFGKKHYGTIYSYVVTGMMLLNAAGLLIIGWLYDVTQGYTVGLMTAVLSYLVVLALSLKILRKSYY